MTKSKCRKIELIFYGYGIQTIFELDDLDIIIDNDKNFKAKGKLNKIRYFGKKYLSKIKNKKK